MGHDHSLGSQGGQKRASDPLELLGLDATECWGSYLGPLQESVLSYLLRHLSSPCPNIFNLCVRLAVTERVFSLPLVLGERLYRVMTSGGIHFSPRHCRP